MISESFTSMVPPELVSVFGMEETQLLQALKGDPLDILSLHFMTGIPVVCVTNKIRALVGLGMVRDLLDGRFVYNGENGFFDV